MWYFSCYDIFQGYSGKKNAYIAAQGVYTRILYACLLECVIKFHYWMQDRWKCLLEDSGVWCGSMDYTLLSCSLIMWKLGRYLCICNKMSVPISHIYFLRSSVFVTGRKSCMTVLLWMRSFLWHTLQICHLLSMRSENLNWIMSVQLRHTNIYSTTTLVQSIDPESRFYTYPQGWAHYIHVHVISM